MMNLTIVERIERLENYLQLYTEEVDDYVQDQSDIIENSLGTLLVDLESRLFLLEADLYSTDEDKKKKLLQLQSARESNEPPRDPILETSGAIADFYDPYSTNFMELYIDHPTFDPASIDIFGHKIKTEQRNSHSEGGEHFNARGNFST